MKYNAILFDFEGTLVDFQWKMDEAVQTALKTLVEMGFKKSFFCKCDYAGIYNKAITEAENYGLESVIVRRGLDEIFEFYDTEAVKRWNLKPGVSNILEKISDQHIGIGLVTNVGLKAVTAILNRFGISRKFKCIVTRNSTSRLKPDATGINIALNLLKACKDDCIFIGDSVTDIIAARSAGIDIGIVLGGESSKEVLLSHNPDLVINKISILLSRIAQ